MVTLSGWECITQSESRRLDRDWRAMISSYDFTELGGSPSLAFSPSVPSDPAASFVGGGFDSSHALSAAFEALPHLSPQRLPSHLTVVR
jgi:hypothetical protein